MATMGAELAPAPGTALRERIGDGPAGYTGVEATPEWAAEVKRLARQRNATILAHNYQLPEIQDVADHVGDSLALSRIAAEAPEMKTRDLEQPIGGVHQAGHRAAPLGDGFFHRPLEDGNEEVVLAFEVQVDGPGGDPGGPRDVGDLRREEPAGGEGVDGGPQDGVAFVRAVETRRGSQ